MVALRSVVLLAMLGCPVASQAATPDPGAPMFLFSGFGTLGLVHSSEDRADFTSSVFEANGAGYTRTWSPNVDSRVGAQVIANFSPTLSAMLQVTSAQRYDGTFTPRVEWANIKFQVTPAFSVRVGRIVLASFLESDSLNVGYSNPWVRPPHEVYNLVPVTNNDGANAIYIAHLGNVRNTLEASIGTSTENDVAGGKDTTKRQWNIADTIETGDFTVHVTYQQARLTIDSLHAFVDTFRQFGAPGIAIANRYDQYDKPLWFAGIGAVYDPGEWFLMAEWGVTEFHSVLGKSAGWYVSGGHRWGTLTPYVTYAQTKVESNTSDPGLTVAGLQPDLAAEASDLNAGLNSVLGSIAVQTTVSIGARWDFTKNMDFKVQYDRSRLGADSPGTLTNLQPNFQPGGVVNLVGIAIDFVF